MNKTQAVAPEETDTNLLISLLESCTKEATAYHHQITINGERYTLIDRRAQWRKKFDSVNSKA